MTTDCYPAVCSAKYYLLIRRPDEACDSALLDKLITYYLLVRPEANITSVSGLQCNWLSAITC